jgi:hypothetical protein
MFNNLVSIDSQRDSFDVSCGVLVDWRKLVTLYDRLFTARLAVAVS